MTGWTKAEYDAAPEMATRLHARILDLKDGLETALNLLERWMDPKPSPDPDALLHDTGVLLKAHGRLP